MSGPEPSLREGGPLAPALTGARGELQGLSDKIQHQTRAGRPSSGPSHGQLAVVLATRHLAHDLQSCSKAFLAFLLTLSHPISRMLSASATAHQVARAPLE